MNKNIIQCDICSAEPKASITERKVIEQKIRMRRFIFRRSFVGHEDAASFVDGYPEVLVKKWRDFDLCNKHANDVVMFLTGKATISLTSRDE